MKREQWSEWVSDFGWLCGRCGVGHLHAGPKKEVWLSTADTDAASKHDWFDRRDAEYRFGALLKCNNPHCGDPVAIAGVYSDEDVQVDHDEYETHSTYRVKAVTPAPLPFPIDKSVPDTVSDHLKSAAGLLWADHDAAGNRIRQSVEALLDQQGVKKSYIEKSKTPGKPGKRKQYPLHQRIEAYKKKNSDAANHLMAIKWIGNAGSHTGSASLSRDQILDALEIMEVVLEEVYVGHRKKIAAKVKKIVATGKPLSPSPKKFKFKVKPKK